VDCGVTTASAIHVAIYRFGYSAKESDDAFIYEGDVRDVKVRWVGNSELLIEYGIGRVFKDEALLHGISIKYRHP
jgi:hypothetical protein